MNDDDLMPFRDDPLVSALRAPAQEHELAGEQAALAMFRQSLPARRRRRRALTRAGVTGAGVILGLGLSGGVAAAYTTDALPDPVQDAVHTVIDPLPIPAPPTAHVRRVRHQLAVARHRAHALAEAEAKAKAKAKAKARHSGQPSPRPSAERRAFPPPPRASGQRRPSVSPSTTPAPPRPTMTVAVSRRVVPVHGQVIVSGRLLRGSTGLPGRVVYAAELPAGESTWHRVADGRTATDGTVSLTVPPLTTNVRVRLVTAQGVTSPSVAVAVVPKLTTTATRSGNDRVVTVTADGGRPGNVVKLFRRDGTAWTPIASTTLGSQNTAQFTVPRPGASLVRYLVRLPATARHAAASVEFVVPAA